MLVLCENCGVQNEAGTRLCAKCGAPMPPRSAGGGFADILSYQPAVQTTPIVCVDPAAQKRVQMLEKRINEAKTLLLITVAAAVLATVFALVALIVTLSSSDNERRDDRIADMIEDEDFDEDTYDEDGPTHETGNAPTDNDTTENTEATQSDMTEPTENDTTDPLGNQIPDIGGRGI